MANEDYTTSTEIDPNNRISVTASVLTYTGLARNESAYRYWDKGVNFFSGDFTHKVDAIYTSRAGDSYCLVCNWVIANDIGAANVLFGTNCLAVFRYEYINLPYIYLREVDAGSIYDSIYTDGNSPQNRYFTITRDENVGAFGTIYLYIYSDIARTNLLSTRSVTLHTSKKDYRYLYAIQSYNDSTLPSLTGRMENLDIGIIVDDLSTKFLLPDFLNGMMMISGG